MEKETKVRVDFRDRRPELNKNAISCLFMEVTNT